MLRSAQHGLLAQLVELFPALSKLPRDSYVVGGAVRDLLAGKAPADADVACHDPLACARALGGKTIRLGKRDHLEAWRLVDGPHVYDFAQILDGEIGADLARRDFTVNAMAVHLGTGELLDPQGGQRDLEARIVRMIDPQNFEDDPLRMLKAVRMAVVHGFDVDGATIEAIRPRATRITEVATERITYELSLIFSANALRKALTLLRETNLADALELRVPDVQEDAVPLSASLAIVVSDPRAYGERWRWSEALIREVLTLQRLVEHHDRIALYDAGERITREVPSLLRALGRDDTLDLPDFNAKPLLTGDEIADIAHIPPGPELGRRKRALLEAEIRGEVKTREQALEFILRRDAPEDLAPTGGEPGGK
jgi:tRNA nucleotidyltransferase/poly(A) polymerase